MYDRKLAYRIALGESELPKDKIKEWHNKYKLLATAEDDSKFQKLADIQKNAIDFADKGKNLLIWSDNKGNGKTSWACRIALSYITEYIRNVPDDIDALPIPAVMFVNVPEFLMLNKMAISDGQIREEVRLKTDRIKRCKIVIWDDIGLMNSSDYDDIIVYTLLNFRLERSKSNIFTSNVSPERLPQVISPAIANRLMYANEDGNIIHITCTSMRGYQSDNH